MTIVGIGVDLVSIDRVRAITQRWHDRFLARIYSDAERQDCFRRTTPYASLAGRFAAKEAILKALGVGWAMGVRWRDVQVMNDAAGRPVARVEGRVQALVKEAGVTGIHVSLSHDGNYAIAQAILTRDR
jgi:holo-[acyl-carrier protein] synthase